MDAPKCKLCQKKHYGLCGIDPEADKVVDDIVKRVEKEKPEPIPFMPLGNDYQTYLKAKEWKRNYMREYMKTRRAEEKQRADK